MENSQENTLAVNNDLVLEIQAQVYLKETRKWAKFMAIVGFIFMGIMVLASLAMFAFSGSVGSLMPFPMGAIGFLYIALAGVYFFPIYYLLQFSNKAKQALLVQNTQSLTESMKYLKSHYKFIGIFTIVMLALYPIGIIVAMVVGFNQGF